MASNNDIATNLSVQCVDNCDGNPGVVVDGHKTFPILSRQDATQGTASGDGQGPQSSVRVFQCPCYEVEDTSMEWVPPETAEDSHASLEEEVDAEE